MLCKLSGPNNSAEGWRDPWRRQENMIVKLAEEFRSACRRQVVGPNNYQYHFEVCLTYMIPDAMPQIVTTMLATVQAPTI